MGTTTHRIALTAAEYVNVSNGNLACTIVKGNASMRLVVGSGDTPPDPATLDYVWIEDAKRITAEGLEAEDDIWLRAEAADLDVVVIRGPARIGLAAS